MIFTKIFQTILDIWRKKISEWISIEIFENLMKFFSLRISDFEKRLENGG